MIQYNYQGEKEVKSHVCHNKDVAKPSLFDRVNDSAREHEHPDQLITHGTKRSWEKFLAKQASQLHHTDRESTMSLRTKSHGRMIERIIELTSAPKTVPKEVEYMRCVGSTVFPSSPSDEGISVTMDTAPTRENETEQIVTIQGQTLATIARELISSSV